MEYIERETAIEAVTVWYKKACQPKNMSSYNLDSAAFYLIGERAAYITAISEIEALLAADVRPVVRGKWIGHQEGRWIYAKCSECGTVHDVKSNFCPNCGAKMEKS